MNEPTLAQWKMRALAAEALLDERDAVIEEMDERIEELTAELSSKPGPPKKEQRTQKDRDYREEWLMWDEDSSERMRALYDQKLREMMLRADEANRRQAEKLLAQRPDLEDPFAEPKNRPPKIGKYEAQIPYTPPSKKSGNRLGDAPISFNMRAEPHNGHRVLGVSIHGKRWGYAIGRDDWHGAVMRGERGIIQLLKHACRGLMANATREAGLPRPSEEIIEQIAEYFFDMAKRDKII